MWRSTPSAIDVGAKMKKSTRLSFLTWHQNQGQTVLPVEIGGTLTTRGIAQPPAGSQTSG